MTERGGSWSAPTPAALGRGFIAQNQQQQRGPLASAVSNGAEAEELEGNRRVAGRRGRGGAVAAAAAGRRDEKPVQSGAMALQNAAVAESASPPPALFEKAQLHVAKNVAFTLNSVVFDTCASMVETGDRLV
uniref:Uncharacterized protein n=1 Tax=Chromera velia CCMP2878 TaxID=1169474 RepID=A0A0G4HGU3_9ALVE|eukprot:Cvel_27451.t1-p1 / transcript=Cvel_27451.t1 / gene=Cvel_27451 / organism=Chromera_velia_CCMP2878 / gene_product=hypothetical protein / transcript_product=hypothetical protein / location=Cvel_scaffold3427:14568-14960(+) / protein_length=131 / sequence_SO=supercontig / SO=protein_coding / is_pseudo=false